MKKIISFDTALKLKKLGFQYKEDTYSEAFYEPNHMWYANHKDKGYILVGSFYLDYRSEGHTNYIITEDKPLIPAPDLNQVQLWLIEKYDIAVHVIPVEVHKRKPDNQKIFFHLELIGPNIKPDDRKYTAYGWGVPGIIHHYFESYTEALRLGIEKAIEILS
jgi:hypothetical protein